MRFDDLADVLTIKETAEFLSVSEPTVRRMIVADDLHAIRVLSRWRIPKWAIGEWVNQGRGDTL